MVHCMFVQLTSVCFITHDSFPPVQGVWLRLFWLQILVCNIRLKACGQPTHAFHFKPILALIDIWSSLLALLLWHPTSSWNMDAGFVLIHTHTYVSEVRHSCWVMGSGSQSAFQFIPNVRRSSFTIDSVSYFFLHLADLRVSWIVLDRKKSVILLTQNQFLEYLQNIYCRTSCFLLYMRIHGPAFLNYSIRERSGQTF